MIACLKVEREKRYLTSNAITWSVVSRFIQNSPWPSILSSDTATSNKVAGTQSILGRFIMSGTVTTLTRVTLGVWILSAITGVVTPIGLSSTIALAGNASVHFTYIADTQTSFGSATTSRELLKWSRWCNLG